MPKWIPVLLLIVSGIGCTTRDFGVDEDSDLGPEIVPNVDGRWIGEHTWEGGAKHIRLVLELERAEREITGSAELTGTVEARLTATGEYDAPELNITLLGRRYDERYILPGRLTSDGTRILAYFRGAGVDFDLTLRRLGAQGN